MSSIRWLASVSLAALSLPALLAAGRADAQQGDQQAALEEVVVTAQKRSERLQDVPSSISVLGKEQIEQASLTSLSEYAGYVPGLSVESGGSPGQSRVVLRGINTNDTGQPPLVGLYIDDSPVGSSSGGVRSAQYAIDLMPYDIERIEVLEGPQGTLYGAATMGGLVKYVLREPDLHHFSAQVGTDLETLDHSGSVGWGIRGAWSGPLIENQLAIRVSAFKKYEPGYIDNIGLGIQDSNRNSSDGVRLALLWEPTENFKLKAATLLQESRSDNNTAILFNTATALPAYGDDTTLTARPEPFYTRTEFSSLSADWNLGFATLTNAPSFMKKHDSISSDESRFGPDIPLLSGGQYAAAPVSAGLLFDLRKWTEELRLASPTEQKFQWLVGGFYTHEQAYNFQLYQPYTTGGAPIDNYPLLIRAITPSHYVEKAVFADLTYAITSQLDINGGVRYAHNDQDLDSTIDGLLIGSTHVNTPSSDDVVTWSGSSRFHLTRDQMFYIRAASGYRPGGANFFPNQPIYGPDTLVDYEAGFKGGFLEDKVQFDATVFDINWNNLQVTQVDSRGFIYTGNGGKAVSRGVEASLADQLSRSLRLNATLSFIDAHLTTAAPGIGGRSGDQLPGSPRWATTLGADYNRPINSTLSLIAGGAYIYRDRIESNVGGAPSTRPMDRRIDVHVGTVLQHVTVRLYVKNLLGEASYSQLYPTPYFYGTPDPPRTIGLAVDANL